MILSTKKERYFGGSQGLQEKEQKEKKTSIQKEN
jgi:hypothetical protein